MKNNRYLFFFTLLIFLISILVFIDGKLFINKKLNLNYVLISPRAPITLNLYEAERYESAVVVKPLVGNLISFSNKGRYEPKLAKSWVRETPTKWRFTLHKDLKCENGELITAESFKKSITTVLKYLIKDSDMPVFNKLYGYKAFKAGQNLSGIQTSGDDIIFNFEQPIRSGLLQILSFAPFGYICSENLNSDGSWKNDSKFISSGPYKVKHIEIGKEYNLEKNKHWVLSSDIDSPQTIHINHIKPSKIESNSFWIVDSFSPVKGIDKDFIKYPLVPEYINPILMGNFENGIFSNKEYREYFKQALEKNRENLPLSWDAHTRSLYFYPNQSFDTAFKTIATKQLKLKSDKPLKIGGSKPAPDSPKIEAWKILEATLKELNLEYQFLDDSSNMASITNQSADLRLVGGSIGGGVEPWGIGMIFCTELGPKFPDPSKKICKMVSSYENDLIDDENFTTNFFKIVEEDAAIVPISHYGIQLYLNENINTETISPLLSVINFDELKLKQ